MNFCACFFIDWLIFITLFVLFCFLVFPPKNDNRPIKTPEAEGKGDTGVKNKTIDYFARALL